MKNRLENRLRRKEEGFLTWDLRVKRKSARHENDSLCFDLYPLVDVIWSEVECKRFNGLNGEEQRTGVKCWTINLEKKEDRLTMRFATDNMTGTLLTAWLKVSWRETVSHLFLLFLLSNTSSTLSLTGLGRCCCSCAGCSFQRHASDSLHEI